MAQFIKQSHTNTHAIYILLLILNFVLYMPFDGSKSFAAQTTSKYFTPITIISAAVG